MSQVDTSWIISVLKEDMTTKTPIHVLQVGRMASRIARKHLGNRGLKARVVPHMNTLVVYLTNSAEAVHVLHFAVDQKYSRVEEQKDASVRFMQSFHVPDVPEALHLMGIILDDLDAKVIDVGQRKKEHNRKVWARPQGPKAVISRMALCDAEQGHFVEPDPLDHFVTMVSGDGNYTPAQVFEWASMIVTNARTKLRCPPIRATLWGLRTITTIPGCSAPAEDAQMYLNRQQLMLWLADDDADWYGVRFVLGETHDFLEFITKVPDFAQAIHMAGMVIEGLGAVVESIGVRSNEINPDVQAKPIHGGKAAQRAGTVMVRASNLVNSPSSIGDYCGS